MPQFERAIGPLGSDRGFKTWNLLLARDEVVALMYSTGETWKLALHLQLGFPPDPGQAWRDNPGSAPFHERRRYRAYVVRELQSITVTVSHGSNYVSLTRANGQYDRYVIQQRPLTEHIMRVLQTMYPSLYQQSGVPKSLMGRLLKW